MTKRNWTGALSAWIVAGLVLLAGPAYAGPKEDAWLNAAALAALQVFHLPSPSYVFKVDASVVVDHNIGLRVVRETHPAKRTVRREDIVDADKAKGVNNPLADNGSASDYNEDVAVRAFKRMVAETATSNRLRVIAFNNVRVRMVPDWDRYLQDHPEMPAQVVDLIQQAIKNGA